MGTRVFLFLLMIFWCASAHAAQSTKDVTASEKLKKDALGTVLGSNAGAVASQDAYVVGSGDILGIEVYGEGSMALGVPGPAAWGGRPNRLAWCAKRCAGKDRR